MPTRTWAWGYRRDHPRTCPRGRGHATRSPRLARSISPESTPRGHGTGPAARTLGGALLPGTARCGRRLAGAAARLSIVGLLPLPRAARGLAGVGRARTRRAGLRRRRRRTRVGRDLVPDPGAQPLLRLRLLGGPRAEAAPADRRRRRPIRRPRLGAVRAGVPPR